MTGTCDPERSGSRDKFERDSPRVYDLELSTRVIRVHAEHDPSDE